ncbi:MAG: PACE efflux transporter [Burkholderiales bacterium]|nr:PACE efflux transporter [Burkholderiales bacterium]
MTGMRRRVAYVALYETFALGVGTLGFFGASDAGIGRAGALAVFASVFAVLWNLTYNALFERWESRQAVRGRSTRRRIAHAVGFECGFLAVLLPVAAWWLSISLARSFMVNLGLNLFFLCYTYAFTWAFDRLFGLPASAR